MPEFKFNPHHTIIICHGQVAGQGIEIALPMAVDTGATFTMIPYEAVQAAGVNPLKARRRIEITTGSGIEYVPMVVIPYFKAYGIEIKNMPVLCHNLPSPGPVEGLLGLDFMKRVKLMIDFSANVFRVPQSSRHGRRNIRQSIRQLKAFRRGRKLRQGFPSNQK